MKKYALGIDTSNYKTSVAVVDNEDNIFYDDRIFLSVKDGELGLRQNEAVFQHIKNLPRLLEDALSYLNIGDISVVAVSDKPRNTEGSYMPCFMAGVSVAKILAAAYKVPLLRVSHQEGHIEAGRRYTELKDSDDFIAFHFSGGTTEALHYKSGKLEIIGGTKDISFGQLLDRTGVAMGYDFPAGEEMDNGAIRYSSGNIVYDKGKRVKHIDIDKAGRKDSIFNLPKTKVGSPYINLSGLETASLRLLDDNRSDILNNQNLKDEFSYIIMDEIGRTILALMEESKRAILKETSNFLFVGGVSSSSFIRSMIEEASSLSGDGVHFASPELASDNGIGVALLGGKSLWP